MFAGLADMVNVEFFNRSQQFCLFCNISNSCNLMDT